MTRYELTVWRELRMALAKEFGIDLRWKTGRPSVISPTVAARLYADVTGTSCAERTAVYERYAREHRAGVSTLRSIVSRLAAAQAETDVPRGAHAVGVSRCA